MNHRNEHEGAVMKEKNRKSENMESENRKTGNRKTELLGKCAHSQSPLGNGASHHDRYDDQRIIQSGGRLFCGRTGNQP